MLCCASTWFASILGPVSDVSRPRAETNSRQARARIGSIGIFFSWTGAGAVLGRLFSLCSCSSLQLGYLIILMYFLLIQSGKNKAAEHGPLSLVIFLL